MTDPTDTAEISDAMLMAKILTQDSDAIAMLYDRHHQAAFSLAYRVLNDVGQAEDVVQEAFLTIWRRATTYQPERGQVRPWLLTIVRNLAINLLKRGRPAPGSVGPLGDQLVDLDQPEVWQVAYEAIRSQEVRSALSGLPAEQRIVIDLAYFGGLSHAEIADRLSVPLGTVKSRIRLASSKLQTTLASYAREMTR